MAVKERPTFLEEQSLRRAGYRLVAGVDEVGRGPLAGPVVAAAVILDPDRIPEGLNDSKKLSEKEREILFDLICATSHVALASLSAARVDALNIRAATLAAMVGAVGGLAVQPDYVLVDGRDIPPALPCPAKALVRGDSLSVSIAAASIVAKVARDRTMSEAERHYPGYGFSRHKGYGSAFHRAALAERGPCALHRRSFEPLKSAMERS